MILITTKLKLKQISPVPPANDDVVDLSSAQDIDGDKTFHHTIKINADSGYNTGLALINISKERNQRMISSYTGDMETIIGSIYWNKNFTTNNNRVGLRATRHDGGSYADLYISINPDGTPITYAPTPATSDNSNKIATTAWVMNRLGAVYKYLGENYVMNAADFDRCGVHYHIASLSTATTINYPSSDNVGDWDMYCFRIGPFTTLVGVTPRSAKLFYAKFWNGNFNGWCVFDPVSISS